MIVSAANPIRARVGDHIIVTFDTASLLKASFLIYVFQILAMLIGAAAGVSRAKMAGFNSSVTAALCSVVAFTVAIVFMKRKGNRLASRASYQPRITRVVRRRAFTAAQVAEMMDHC